MIRCTAPIPLLRTFVNHHRFKTRRNVAIVKRFILSCVLRRRRRKQIRLGAAVAIQRAWRRRVLCVSLGRIVMATAAIEVTE